MYTDASGHGWGAHVASESESLQFQGTWNAVQREWSSNHKELVAVLYAIRQLPMSFTGVYVVVYSDNRAAVGSINRLGS